MSLQEQEALTEELVEETAADEIPAETVENEENINEEAQKLSAELADLNQKFLRVAADFENYKRRTTQEKNELLSYSNAKLVSDLLPIIDNFQLALKNSSDNEEVKSFLKGVEMIYTQLMGVLEGAGLKVIETVGQPFDPNKHEAIMQVADDSVDDDTVVEEVRCGYQFKDKVLRPSMVKVSTK